MHTAMKYQTGITLIEVMIAVLVLSFGLIGMAALQARSIQTNQSAFYQSVAAALATEAIDLIRSNRDQRGEYTLNFGGTPSSATRGGRDMAIWAQKLQQQLPNGQAQIQLVGPPAPVGWPNAAPRQIQIQIRWTDARWREDPADQQNTYTVNWRM